VDWPGNIESIISRVEALLESCKPARIFIQRRKVELLPSPSITIDNRNVLHDTKLGFIAPALDPQQVVAQFKRLLPHRPEREDSLRLRSIGVVRHKPQRRCLIEYEFDGSGTENDSSSMTLIGKVNAKFPDLFSYRIQQTLFEEAFHPTAEDGICVPQPLGVIPEWHMWLQQKAQGDRLTNHLELTGAEQLVARTTQAIYKLHCTAMPVHRTHTPRDELDILHKCVPKVLRTHPEWQEPVRRILAACDRLAASLPNNCKTFLHRDFYPDQLLVDGGNMTLLDFDLCCLGDPALDIGNFHAHLTEHALRHVGQPETLSSVQNAFLESYSIQAGENILSRAKIYSTLTLVRHIYLSSLFPDRRHLTPALIELSSQQLGVRLKDVAVATSSMSSRTSSHVSFRSTK
jgi:Ser/Thr protein kinase RdoA (MazF antagonist)